MADNGRRKTQIDMNTRGRRGRETRLPFQHRRKNPALLLVAVSAVLLIGAAATYLAIYREGNEAQKNAQDLLSQYDNATTASASPDAGTASLPAGSDTSSTLPTESALPPDDGYQQPDAPEVDPKDELISLPGYDVIGKLSIDAINVELPVIAKLTTKALKVSVCWYGGAMPGEKGNIIITGHNYKSGAHFGRLDKLKTGDEVVLAGPDGTVYHYLVYETQVVTPDNVAALDKASGDYTLTLLTCASSGNRRLIVRCKLNDAN